MLVADGQRVYLGNAGEEFELETLIPDKGRIQNLEMLKSSLNPFPGEQDHERPDSHYT